MSLIVTTPEPPFTVFSFAQPSNALLPMVLMFAPMVIFVSFLFL